MKRLDIVNGKLKKLYDVLFSITNSENSNKPSTEKIENTKNEIRKYEREKTTIYLKESNKWLKEMPWLKDNETYKKLMTHNAEFNCLFLELIHKCPSMVDDMDLLMPIVDFVNNGTNKISRVRELLTLNRNVLSDKKLLKRINDKCYPQIKEVLKSITLMSNSKFREYLAEVDILSGRVYDDVRLMERAFKEGLNLDLVLALGSKKHARDYFYRNMSKELLDHIASAKTKTLKKQILSLVFDCNNDKILNILARFFEIEVIRDALLDENSFYYNLLIKPIYEGVSHKDYAVMELSKIPQEYMNIEISQDLLDQVAKSTTKTLKKQILAMAFNCRDENILNILVNFLEIDEVRSQLLDENSFYYKLLIKPISKGIASDKYASIDQILSTCSTRFNDYILNCDNTDILAHSFDCIAGPYIYYFREGQMHSVPVSKFTSSFNGRIDKFHKILAMINMLDNSKQQAYLNTKYEDILNDDLREVARNAILDNEDAKLSLAELEAWNSYIDATYGLGMKESLDDVYDVVIGYGLDSFEDNAPKSLNYSYCWTINASDLLVTNK